MGDTFVIYQISVVGKAKSVSRGEHFHFLVADVDPLIFQNILGRQTLFRVFLENLVHEFASSRRNMIREL